MMKIKKGLFFKIAAICVSICLFVDAIAYAAPGLRVNLMFNRVEKNKKWNKFEEWFFRDVKEAYEEGSLSEERFREMMAVKESHAMKVYGQAYGAQLAPMAVHWSIGLILTLFFGVTGNLDFGTGYVSFWLPSAILRIVPISYFWWKNPKVNFAVGFILGIVSPPGFGFLGLPIQAIFSFRKIFYLKIKRMISAQKPSIELLVSRINVVETNPSLLPRMLSGSSRVCQ